MEALTESVRPERREPQYVSALTTFTVVSLKRCIWTDLSFFFFFFFFFFSFSCLHYSGAGFGELTNEIFHGQCAVDENAEALDSQIAGL